MSSEGMVIQTWVCVCECEGPRSTDHFEHDLPLVSLYFFSTLRWGSWYTHTFSFLNRLKDYNTLLLVKYEDIKYVRA